MYSNTLSVSKATKYGQLGGNRNNESFMWGWKETHALAHNNKHRPPYLMVLFNQAYSQWGSRLYTRALTQITGRRRQQRGTTYYIGGDPLQGEKNIIIQVVFVCGGFPYFWALWEMLSTDEDASTLTPTAALLYNRHWEFCSGVKSIRKAIYYTARIRPK